MTKKRSLGICCEKRGATVVWSTVALTDARFSLLRDLRQGAILTAKMEEGSFNGMTVSWGGVGVLWGKNVMFFFVRPERYTFSLLTAGSAVTLSFFGETYREVLRFYGKASGRTVNKAEACDLHPFTLPSGGIGYEEAERILAGRLLYGAPLVREGILDGEIASFYTREGYHRVFIAEMAEIYENRA